MGSNYDERNDDRTRALSMTRRGSCLSIIRQRSMRISIVVSVLVQNKTSLPGRRLFLFISSALIDKMSLIRRGYTSPRSLSDLGLGWPIPSTSLSTTTGQKSSSISLRIVSHH